MRLEVTACIRRLLTPCTRGKKILDFGKR